MGQKIFGALATVIYLGQFSRGWHVGEIIVSYILKLSINS